MLSSLATFSPISYCHVDAHPYIYKAPEDFLSNTHLKLFENINIDSISNKTRDHNGPHKNSKNDKPRAYVSLTTLSFHEDSKLVDDLFHFSRSDVFLNSIEEKGSDIPQKKVKTEKDISFGQAEYDWGPIKSKPFKNFFATEDSAEYFENYTSDALPKLYEEEEDIYAFWEHKETPGENLSQAISTIQVPEILKDDSSNKCEDIINRTYFFETTFWVEPETSNQSCPSSPEKLELPVIELDNSTSKENLPPVVQKVVRESSNIDQNVLKNCLHAITETDLQRLEPEVYINDNIINFYLKLIEHAFLSKERRKKCHFFNTYFMAQMRQLFSNINSDITKFDRVYEKMGKWTKKTNLFEKDFIFIPVNENEHWNLIILCYPYKLFTNDDEMPLVVFLDSLSRMDNIFATILLEYFSREIQTKMSEEFPKFQEKLHRLKASSFPYFQPMVPKQSNSTDCGLYLLQYAEMFAEDETLILDSNRDMFKNKWFPRKVAENKRKDIKKIIKELKADNFGEISQYLTKREKIMNTYAKYSDQYSSFDKKQFQKALNQAFRGINLSYQEKSCLMLDFYYFGTLEFSVSTSYR